MPSIDSGFGADGSLVSYLNGLYAIAADGIDCHARYVSGPCAIRGIDVSVQLCSAVATPLPPTAAFAAGAFRLIVVRGTGTPPNTLRLSTAAELQGFGQIVFARLCPANNQGGVFTFTEKELTCGRGEYLTVICSGVIDNAGNAQLTVATIAVTGHPTSEDATSQNVRFR
jgi:hypothetical protein